MTQVSSRPVSAFVRGRGLIGSFEDVAILAFFSVGHMPQAIPCCALVRTFACQRSSLRALAFKAAAACMTWCAREKRTWVFGSCQATDTALHINQPVVDCCRLQAHSPRHGRTVESAGASYRRSSQRMFYGLRTCVRPTHTRCLQRRRRPYFTPCAASTPTENIRA